MCLDSCATHVPGPYLFRCEKVAQLLPRARPLDQRIGAANASERSRSGGQAPLKRLALGVELISMSDRRLGEAWPQMPVPLGFLGEAA